MSISGQSNYRGVNSQAKAALLLFLTNFYEGDFYSMTLEDSEWEDFTLSFQSGKKIIAEAKFWQRPLILNDVVKILQGIAPKAKNINPGDEILIVCKSIDDRVIKASEHLRYSLPVSDIPLLKAYQKPEKLTSTVLQLLKQTRFYQLPENAAQSQDDYLFNETASILYRMLPMWLPQHELEMLMTRILKEQIYDKSESGATLTKLEFTQLLENYRSTKISESVVYDPERQQLTEQVRRIVGSIRDDKISLEASGNLVALSAQPVQMYIALDIISQIENLQLNAWDFLWKALINRSYGYRVVGIFEDNLDGLKNSEYVIAFLTAAVDALSGISMEGHSREHALTLISKILDLHPTLYKSALDFISGYLEPRITTYKNASSKRDLSYEKDTVGDILTSVYDAAYSQQDDAVMREIIELIAKFFNLAEDDGEYLSETPQKIYQLVRRWLGAGFYERIHFVTEMIVADFNESEFYHKGFKGWELMGGMESGYSSHYVLHDRGFIEQILAPVMTDEYESDSRRLWDFAEKNIFTRSEHEVTAIKPDFLSRAAIPFIVSAYFETELTGTDEILKDFIRIRKGIPDRGRLIFQLLRSRGDSNEKMWSLADFYLSLSPDGLPYNVYLEDVVLNLAVKGNRKASQHIKSWMSNPEYVNKANRFHFYADTVIERLLNSPLQSVQKDGIGFLKDYLSKSGGWEKGDDTRTWDVNPLLFKALSIDRQATCNLIESMYLYSGDLRKNRQLVMTALLAEPNLKSKSDVIFLFENIVKPILIDDLGGEITNITKKFNYRHARDNFVSFAEKLIEVGKIEEGLGLVRIFMNDPDPILDNYPDDKVGDFNYHNRLIAGEDTVIITTVRGRIPFALLKAIKPRGKKFIPEIIDIAEKLLSDQNYYVRFMALTLLAGLAQNKHSVVSNKNKRRFMSVSNAQRIKDIAFRFLEDEENRSIKALMERTLYCFNFIRDLDEANAKRLIDSARKLEFSGDIDHLAGLYLYFAEFRRSSFTDSSSERHFGKRLFANLVNFDDSYFKTVLEDEISNSDNKMRRHLAWQFWKLTKDDKESEEYQRMFDISYHYLSAMAGEYDHESFEMLFHFVDDNLKKSPEKTIALWNKAIESERKYLCDHEDDIIYHQNYWDRSHTVDTLLFILESQGQSAFLASLNTLLSYPRKLQHMHNAQNAYEALKQIDTNEAKATLSTFQENYPQIYARDLSVNES